MRHKINSIFKMIIIDNGHGRQTPGKCSPDRRLQEWKWTRQAAAMLARRLNENNMTSTLLVPGEDDVPLAQRCTMANNIARQHPGSILISLHTNAAGNGSAWHKASGWSVFVHPRASPASRALAAALFAEASAADILGNRATPSCGYLTANLAILRNTICPAVLTENMFHDNAADAAFLLSPSGLNTIVEIHLRAILAFAKHSG